MGKPRRSTWIVCNRSNNYKGREPHLPQPRLLCKMALMPVVLDLQGAYDKAKESAREYFGTPPAPLTMSRLAQQMLMPRPRSALACPCYATMILVVKPLVCLV